LEHRELANEIFIPAAQAVHDTPGAGVFPIPARCDRAKGRPRTQPEGLAHWRALCRETTHFDELDTAAFPQAITVH
jgi:hypothetical protein